MPGESCVNAITLMLFFVTLLPLLAVEATYSRTENGLAKSTDTFDREDLSAMLRRAPFHDARVFEIARKHIQEIETSPACHQLATSTLINSCQSFSSLPGKDSARITDNSLDEVRQEYAARLAVCELQGIKSGIPRECVPFLASHEACPRASPSGFFRKNRPALYEPRRACYPEFTPEQLKQCVDSLFDHGQRWTSYSNAQTNAIVICQASRGAVENGQLFSVCLLINFTMLPNFQCRAAPSQAARCFAVAGQSLRDTFTCCSGNGGSSRATPRFHQSSATISARASRPQ